MAATKRLYAKLISIRCSCSSFLCDGGRNCCILSFEIEGVQQEAYGGRPGPEEGAEIWRKERGPKAGTRARELGHGSLDGSLDGWEPGWMEGDWSSASWEAEEERGCAHAASTSLDGSEGAEGGRLSLSHGAWEKEKSEEGEEVGEGVS